MPARQFGAWLTSTSAVAYPYQSVLNLYSRLAQPPPNITPHPARSIDFSNPLVDFGNGLKAAAVLAQVRTQIALGPIDLATLKVAPSPSLFITHHTLPSLSRLTWRVSRY
jgi:hypothetical protein